MKIVDNRGLNCPEPLLKTRQALQETDELISLVDNEAARENILRYAHSQGLTASWEAKDNYYALTIGASTKGKKPTEDPGGMKTGTAASQCRPRTGKPLDTGTVIMISGNRLGQGGRALGELLMRSFIFTLTKRELLPGTIILMNSGAKLSGSNSPVREELQQLEQEGVKILTCGTCLDYYKLTADLAVGEITNMYDTTELITSASRTIIL